VRQHYLDFLSREHEAGEPWSNVLNRCPNVNNDPSCDRIFASQSFFRSPEFQLKGFYVFRFYRLAFNPLPEYTEIVSDMSYVAGAIPQEVCARKAQLATLFTERAELSVEQPSGMLVALDVAVDGLVADAQTPETAQMSRDLLGAPLAAQQLVNRSEVVWREAEVAARARAPPIGSFLGRAGAVGDAGAGAVAAQFAAHRGAVAAEQTGDLRTVQALPSEGGKHIPLLWGESAVRLDVKTSSGWLKSSSVPPLLRLQGGVLHLGYESALPVNLLTCPLRIMFTALIPSRVRSAV
jgi:hypothetical protein